MEVGGIGPPGLWMTNQRPHQATPMVEMNYTITSIKNLLKKYKLNLRFYINKKRAEMELYPEM